MEKTPSLLRMPALEAFAEIRRRFSAAVSALVTPSRPSRAALAPRPDPSPTAIAPQAPCPPPCGSLVSELGRKWTEYSRRTGELIRRYGLENVAREWAREIAPIRDAEARLGAVARHPVVRRAMSFYTPQDDFHVQFALLYCALCDVPSRALQLDPVSLSRRPARVAEANRRRFAREIIFPATGDDAERDGRADPLGQLLREHHAIRSALAHV